MRTKTLLFSALLSVLLCITSFAATRIDTSNLETVYSNTFDDSSALNDFTQYYGSWEVKGGRLYLTSVSEISQSFILYTGDSSLTSLTDYVVDVDMYNVQSQGGVILRSDLSRILDGKYAEGNNFYGYIGFLSFTGELGVIGYGRTDGGYGGNCVISKNITTPAENVHLQFAVKGNTVTLNIYDIDRDRLVWSASYEDSTHTSGSFGMRLYGGNDKTFEGETVCNLNATCFDNLTISTYSTKAPEPEETDTSVMTFTNPVATGADPYVLKDGDTYYLYATTGDAHGYRVFTSKNLVEWEAHGYCLLASDEDVFTDENSPHQSNKLYWAPEVIKYNGKYYMTVSFQHHLNFAVSDSPLGPFKTIGEDILFPGIGTIDGHFFLDDDGTMYFYFVTEGAATLNGQSTSGGWNNIWGCKIDMDVLASGKSAGLDRSSITLLLKNDSNYEEGANIVEGPFMLKNNGKYYLTFSSGGYANPHYSVHYAVSENPLSGFKRDAKNVALKSDDLYYEDIDNPHLYGTAHHAFVEAPNGKDLLIIYHAHRTNRTWAEGITDFCSPRSVCVDLAWFEGDYLFAGSKESKTVPTATAQPILEGTTLTRKTYLNGEFAQLANLPTVYVAYTDGNEENTGAKNSPVKTVEQALSLLPNGGTIVLTQNYSAGSVFKIPKVNGPLMITSEHANVVFTFKFMKIESDVYFENLFLAPSTLNDISVIECNFNNVVFGEGVSCINRPYGDLSYPYIVGGRWQYNGSETNNSTYNENFKYDLRELYSDKEYVLAVLGGTYEKVTAGSLNYRDVLGSSAPNAKVINSGEEFAFYTYEIKIPDSEGEKITKGELSYILAQMMTGADENILNTKTKSDLFFDAVEYGAAIEYLVKNGFTSGKSEKIYGTDDEIIYSDFVAIAVRCLGYETDDMSFPYGYILAANRLGILNGVTETDYTNVLSREDVYTVLLNMLDTSVAETDPITLKILFPDEIGIWETTSGERLNRYTLYETTFLGKNNCNFSDWETTVEPTYSTSGEEYRVCSVCGKKEIVAIPKLASFDANNDGKVSLLDVLAVIKIILNN